MNDGVACLSWASAIWCASLAGFVLLRPICRGWPDEGYGLARIAGPLWLGTLAWMLHAWLGLRWSVGTAAIAALVLLAGALLAGRGAPRVPPAVLSRCMALDLLWLATFAAFLVLRSWSPSIVGAERPMDHALLAGVLRATHLPPADPWLAGHAINYHHAGQVLWTPLVWLSGVPIAVAYNLLTAMVPAVAVTAAASIGMRIAPRYWGWGAAALACAAPPAVLALAWRTQSISSSVVAPTRVIEGAVSEYPFFSFAWGDLHGHVLALAWLVLAAGLLIAAADRVDEEAAGGNARWTTRVAGVFAGLACVACVLTSSWDLPTLAIGGCGWCVLVARQHGLGRAVRVAGPAVIAAALVAWPVVSVFRPPAVNWGWEHEGTTLLSFVAVHGAWVAPVVAALACVSPRLRRPTVVAIAIVALTAVVVPAVAVRLGLVLLLIALVRQVPFGRPATALLAWAVLAWLLAETIWVDDVYGWALRRYNTVFKWQLHAVVLTLLALPAALQALASAGRSAQAPRMVSIATWVVRGAATVAVVGAALVVTGLWSAREPRMSFDALASLERRAPGDAAIVRHLWTESEPGEVVLEAPGRPYTRLSRISALSGQPTLIGWEGHERLWRRGDAWSRVITARREAVDGIYAGAPEAMPALVREHDVRFIVIGDIERERYPSVDATRFAGVADVVFHVGTTELLRVR